MPLNFTGQFAARRLLQLQRMRRKLRSRRVDARLPVTLIYQGRELPCLSENISISGLYLHSPEALPDQAEVQIRVELPDGTPLRFKGRVVRLGKTLEGGVHGLGVHLHDLDQKTYKDWTRFLGLLGKTLEQFPGGVRPQKADPEATKATAARPRLRPRRLVHIEIQLTSVEEMMDVLERDISIGGVFVKLERFPKPGAPVLLTFIHPTGEGRFSFSGRIDHAISEPAHERGVGIYFDECTYEQRDAFLQFIEEGLPELEPLGFISQDEFAALVDEAAQQLA